MVGHDHGGMQMDFIFVIMKAMLKNKISGGRDKDKFLSGAESDEMWSIGFLNVRQIAAVHMCASSDTAEGGCATRHHYFCPGMNFGAATLTRFILRPTLIILSKGKSIAIF